MQTVPNIILTHCSRQLIPASSRATFCKFDTSKVREIAGGGGERGKGMYTFLRASISRDRANLETLFGIKHERQLTRVEILHYPAAFRYCITLLKLGV